MRRHPVLRSATIGLGFVPPLVALVLATEIHHLFVLSGFLFLRFPEPVWGQMALNVWLLGGLCVLYVLWAFALARGWVSSVTGGGFVIAAYALSMRMIAELPYLVMQIPWSEERPPEPYGSTLAFAQDLGMVGLVAGLAFVVAAVISERLLRRVAPEWTRPV